MPSTCKNNKFVNHFSDSQAKEKWKNLRAVFVRHIKPAPSGSSSKKKKPYYLTDAMQFTIPYVKALNNTISGNLPLAADREVTEQEDNEMSQMSQSILQQNIALPPQNMPSSSEDTPSPMSCPLPESSPISNQPLSPMSCPPSRSFASSTDIGSNRRKRKPDTVDDGIMEYFKAKRLILKKSLNTRILNEYFYSAYYQT